MTIIRYLALAELVTPLVLTLAAVLLRLAT